MRTRVWGQCASGEGVGPVVRVWGQCASGEGVGTVCQW